MDIRTCTYRFETRAVSYAFYRRRKRGTTISAVIVGNFHFSRLKRLSRDQETKRTKSVFPFNQRCVEVQVQTVVIVVVVVEEEEEEEKKQNKKKEKISTTRFLLSFARITRRTEASLLRFRYVFIPTVYMFLSCVTIKTSGDINVDTDFFFFARTTIIFPRSETVGKLSREDIFRNSNSEFIHAHARAHIYTYTHARTHTHMYIYMYTCTYAH